MAVIYLKVPWYVAAHFRGRDEENQLTEWDAVVFSDYEHEFQVMENHIRYIPEDNQSTLCYSQSAWKNICHGKKPSGGKVVIKRDATLWPTTNELCTLTGAKYSGRMTSSDYLCIRLPREAWVGGQLRRVNSCYCLSYDMAMYLTGMLYTRFCYEYMQWTEQDQRNFERISNERAGKKIDLRRKINETQGRYFTQYNFPVISDERLKESLRRMHNRWLRDAMRKSNHHLVFNHSFLEHISEEEEEKLRKAEEKKRKAEEQ